MSTAPVHLSSLRGWRTDRIAVYAAWLFAGFVATAGAAWMGWESAGDQAKEGLAVSPSASAASGVRRLLLPEPPPVRAEPASEKSETLIAASKKREVVAGGEKADPLIEMWEMAYLRPPATSPEPLTPPHWFITGLASRGRDQLVIVQRGTDPKPHFYKVGDILPGGARIVWVKPGVIGLTTPRRERVELPLNR